MPCTVCPLLDFLQRGSWRSTTYSPGALSPSAMENILLDFFPVAVKGGPCQVYSLHSDICICWSAGSIQVGDTSESTMTVGTIPLVVAAWRLSSVSILGSSLLTSSCALWPKPPSRTIPTSKMLE